MANRFWLVPALIAVVAAPAAATVSYPSEWPVTQGEVSHWVEAHQEGWVYRLYGDAARQQAGLVQQLLDKLARGESITQAEVAQVDFNLLDRTNGHDLPWASKWAKIARLLVPTHQPSVSPETAEANAEAIANADASSESNADAESYSEGGDANSDSTATGGRSDAEGGDANSDSTATGGRSESNSEGGDAHSAAEQIVNSNPELSAALSSSDEQKQKQAQRQLSRQLQELGFNSEISSEVANEVSSSLSQTNEQTQGNRQGTSVDTRDQSTTLVEGDRTLVEDRREMAPLPAALPQEASSSLSTDNEEYVEISCPRTGFRAVIRRGSANASNVTAPLGSTSGVQFGATVQTGNDLAPGQIDVVGGITPSARGVGEQTAQTVVHQGVQNQQAILMMAGTFGQTSVTSVTSGLPEGCFEVPTVPTTVPTVPTTVPTVPTTVPTIRLN